MKCRHMGTVLACLLGVAAEAPAQVYYPTGGGGGFGGVEQPKPPTPPGGTPIPLPR